MSHLDPDASRYYRVSSAHNQEGKRKHTWQNSHSEKRHKVLSQQEELLFLDPPTTPEPTNTEVGLRRLTRFEDTEQTANQCPNTLPSDPIIMATAVEDNGTLGCAYFSAHDNRLSVAQDIPLADESTMSQFLSHIQPSSIFTVSNLPDNLMEMLDDYADGLYEGQSNEKRFIS